tara:strand:+ start:446 stop:640 length:195 start_codon:yes stop_codon:yes gene_type:complete
MLLSHVISGTQANLGGKDVQSFNTSPVVPKKRATAAAFKLAQEARWNDRRLNISSNSLALTFQM